MSAIELNKIIKQLNSAIEQKKDKFHIKSLDNKCIWFFSILDKEIMLGIVGTTSPILTILEQIAINNKYAVHASFVNKNLQLSVFLHVKDCTFNVLQDCIFYLNRIAHES